jgi:hypothetical protein
MAGFGDLGKKAQQLLNDPKVKDALKSEKAEGVTDRILGGVAGAVDKATGGKHSEQIDRARDAADRKLGNQ